MRILVAIITLLTLNALAQFESIPFLVSATTAPSGAAFSPTNIAGYPAISWWVASDYTTNGAAATLPDRAISGYNLTNLNTPSFPSRVTNMLWVPSLLFDGVTNYLKSVNYTSSQPHEVVMLGRFTTTTPVSRYGFDSAATGARNSIFTGASANQLSMYGGNTIGPVGFTFTNWFVFDAIFNGASSSLLTNSIALISTADVGTQKMNGFTLAARYTGLSQGPIELVEMATYATNLPYSAQSNLWVYWFVKAGLVPGPFIVTNASTNLTTPTYVGAGEVVHPDIQYVSSGWGWSNRQYWMAYAPFPSGSNVFENPSIVCSTNGTDWDVPTGLVNPIVTNEPLYQLADPELFIWTNNIAYCFYYWGKDAVTNEIRCLQSTNGVNWTGPSTIFCRSFR